MGMNSFSLSFFCLLFYLWSASSIEYDFTNYQIPNTHKYYYWPNQNYPYSDLRAYLSIPACAENACSILIVPCNISCTICNNYDKNCEKLIKMFGMNVDNVFIKELTPPIELNFPLYIRNKGTTIQSADDAVSVNFMSRMIRLCIIFTIYGNDASFHNIHFLTDNTCTEPSQRPLVFKNGGTVELTNIRYASNDAVAVFSTFNATRLNLNLTVLGHQKKVVVPFLDPQLFTQPPPVFELFPKMLFIGVDGQVDGDSGLLLGSASSRRPNLKNISHYIAFVSEADYGCKPATVISTSRCDSIASTNTILEISLSVIIACIGYLGFMRIYKHYGFPHVIASLPPPKKQNVKVPC
jgi:hypothetical protein